MQIDGRVVTLGEMDDIIAGTKFTNFVPKFMEVHNTSIPDMVLFRQWMEKQKPTFEQWLKNLAAFYAGKGWKGGPHFFVAPDGRIGMLTPMNMRGTHSPSWNDRAIGIETVGEFQREVFAGTSSEYALVGLLGALHWHLGLSPDHYVLGVSGIHFHKEDKRSDHDTCPGKNMVKADLVANVVAYIKRTYNGSHDDVRPSDISARTDTSRLPPEAMGNRGVYWVQEQLNKWILSKDSPGRGIKLLKIDGSYGDKTESAVTAFQKSEHLDVDGVAGSQTRIALNRF